MVCLTTRTDSLPFWLTNLFVKYLMPASRSLGFPSKSLKEGTDAMPTFLIFVSNRSRLFKNKRMDVDSKQLRQSV
jgi:hypothetical protein